MNITITKITNKQLLDLACSYTAGKDVNVKDIKKFYLSEHSPIRTQMFVIEMQDIPSFVSTHFVRHKIGVEHFVKSNRPDRGGDGEANRNSPVSHLMFCNAQALINMARKRLCGKASIETQEVMHLIWHGVNEVDPELARCMVPDCEYRGGCYEFSTCGRIGYKL